MFFAHLPAGYLVGKAVNTGVSEYSRWQRPILYSAMAGSVLPDIDWLYFQLVDRGQGDYHGYWLHFPFVWVALLLLSTAVAWKMRNRNAALALVMFPLTGLLHMVLDSMVGAVQWLQPFSNTGYRMFAPLPEHSGWLAAFLHWPVLLELAITVAALKVLRSSRKKAALRKTSRLVLPPHLFKADRCQTRRG